MRDLFEVYTILVKECNLSYKFIVQKRDYTESKSNHIFAKFQDNILSSHFQICKSVHMCK